MELGRRCKNWTGTKVGKLTPIEPVYEVSRGIAWLCQCDCGVSIIRSSQILAQALRKGNVSSCGCDYKGRANPKTLPEGEASFNQLYSRYKLRANKKGLVFELTKKQFRELTSLPCVYDGSLPSQVSGRYDNRLNGTYTYNGIDRVDSSKGYTVDNCVPCCKTCNTAKGTMSLEEFKSWLARAFLTSCESI